MDVLKRYAKILSAIVAFSIAINAAIVAYDATFNYPARSAKNWQYGIREAVQYVDSIKSDYDRIIVSHKVRLHPISLACFTGMTPQPFDGKVFPKYVIPFYHYVPMYRDFRMKEYQQYGLISRWYTMGRGKNLLLAEGGEIEGKPLKQFFEPNGTVAYEVFETNR